MFACQTADQIMIKRLRKACIGNRRGKTGSAQLIGGGEAFLQARSEGQQRHLRTFTHDASLANFKHRTTLRQVDADAIATRIAEGNRAFVIFGSGTHHMAQFGLIGRSHHYEAGKG